MGTGNREVVERGHNSGREPQKPCLDEATGMRRLAGARPTEPEVHVQGPGLYAKNYGEQLKQNHRIRRVLLIFGTLPFPEATKKESRVMDHGGGVGWGTRQAADSW